MRKFSWRSKIQYRQCAIHLEQAETTLKENELSLEAAGATIIIYERQMEVIDWGALKTMEA